MTSSVWARWPSKDTAASRTASTDIVRLTPASDFSRPPSACSRNSFNSTLGSMAGDGKEWTGNPQARSPSAAILFAMKVHTEYLTFHTRKHREYVHMTPQVESAVKKSGVKEGMALVSAMHITAGIYVNDDESGLIHDIDEWLEKLAPFRKEYQHHQTGEDNGDSHLKAILVHHQVILPITAGKLDLGTWQRVFYAEFDGQRDKRVIIKVMGE